MKKKPKSKVQKTFFNKVKEEKFPQIRERISIKKQEAYQTQNRNGRKKSLWPIIIKTLNVQNKERLLKATWNKEQVMNADQLE